jgi:uncharacterized membrane protein YbhN (UPF0104 family)
MADSPGAEVRSDHAGQPGGRPLAHSLIGYSIVGIFLLLCAYYVYAHQDDFAFAASISLSQLAVAGFFVLFAFLVSAYQFGLFLREFDIALGKVELLALTMAMCLGNLLIPMRGGTGVSALYLKKAHHLDFRSFAVIYGGTGVLIAMINTAVALASLLILWFFHGLFFRWLVLFTAVMFLLCLYLSFFPPPARWKGGRVLGAIFDAVHCWHLLTRDRVLLAKLSVSFLVVALALAASFHFIYGALGKPLSVEGSLITSSLGNIANLAAITPGSLGIFDTVVIEIPQTFGLDPARSLAGALLFRVVSFFWAFVLGIPGILYVTRLTGRRDGDRRVDTEASGDEPSSARG